METSETFYTQFANSYEKYSATKESYLSAVNNFIKNEVDCAETIIDVGCGNGKRSKIISNLLKAKSLTLFDNSEGMLNLAKNIPNIRIVKGDISDPNFKSEDKYDVVLCLWNVLGHIKADKRLYTLKNLASLVRDGGFIFLDVNNRYNICNYGTRSVLKNVCKDVFCSSRENGDFKLSINTEKGTINTMVHIFNPQEVEKLFELANIKVQKREIINYKTGKKSKSIWGGQLVYKLTKK